MKLNDDICLRIVIPTYNRADELIECLGSLIKAGIRETQIIVVDNNSQDNTAEMLKKNFPKMHARHLDENSGATGASNIGFKLALEQGATHVLRLDSDTIVAPDFLRPLIEQIQANPKIGAVAPKIYYFDPPEKIWYAGADSHPFHFGAINSQRQHQDSPENQKIKEVDYAWGAAMLIKAEVLAITGGFDNDFFVYYEEIDFCLRIKKMGYKILLVPASTLWHKVGSSANNAWTAYHWNRSKMLLFRKHAKSSVHSLALIFYAFGYVIYDSLLNKLKLKAHSGNRGPLVSALKGLLAGLTEKIPLHGEKHDLT
jgi:GT2 family glycosyltransferase